MTRLPATPLPQLRRNGWRSVMMFFLVALLCMIVGSVIVSLIIIKGQTTLTMRLAMVVQDVVMFILPPLITAMLLTRLPATLLCVDRGFSVREMTFGILALILAVPAMGALEEWNSNLTLPASLAGVEQWMRASEQAAAAGVELMMGGTSVIDLVLGLLLIALLAGLSEELFFRAGLQRLLASTKLGPHGAIWLTAIVFSAFHMQFFGFFPRLALGVLFGYVLYWTGSVWLPVLLHALNNGIVVYTTWRARCGGATMAEAQDTTAFGSDSPIIVALSILSVAVVIFYLCNITKKKQLQNFNN